MTTLIIGAQQEQQAAELIALAHANPLSREYLTRMSQVFDPADPATRPAASDVIPLQFTIDLPVGVRVTYTEEEQPIGACRHLSVSIDRPGMIPGPPVVDELLGLFGFAGKMASAGECLVLWPEHYANRRIAVNVLEPITVPVPA